MYKNPNQPNITGYGGGLGRTADLFKPRSDPPTFERLYAIIEYLPGEHMLLPTDMYRKRGTDRWQRQHQWEDEEINPTPDCTHIFVSGTSYDLNSIEGADLEALAEKNLEALQTVSSKALENVPTPLVPTGSSNFLVVMLLIIDIVVSSLVLLR